MTKPTFITRYGWVPKFKKRRLRDRDHVHLDISAAITLNLLPVYFLALFSTFFAHLASPAYAPGTTAVDVTWMEREFNMLVKRFAACTHVSSTISEI